MINSHILVSHNIRVTATTALIPWRLRIFITIILVIPPSWFSGVSRRLVVVPVPPPSLLLRASWTTACPRIIKSPALVNMFDVIRVGALTSKVK